MVLQEHEQDPNRSSPGLNDCDGSGKTLQEHDHDHHQQISVSPSLMTLKHENNSNTIEGVDMEQTHQEQADNVRKNETQNSSRCWSVEALGEEVEEQEEEQEEEGGGVGVDVGESMATPTKDELNLNERRQPSAGLVSQRQVTFGVATAHSVTESETNTSSSREVDINNNSNNHNDHNDNNTEQQSQKEEEAKIRTTPFGFYYLGEDIDYDTFATGGGDTNQDSDKMATTAVPAYVPDLDKYAHLDADALANLEYVPTVLKVSRE